MWEEVLKMAATNGLWAVLFCVLLVYQLKESKIRESKYQAAIKGLSENLGIVRKIREDVAQIKQSIEKKQNVQKEENNHVQQECVS